MDPLDAEVIPKIMEAVGKPVQFDYPGSEGQKKGILKRRSVIRSNPGTSGVPYWDVVDLIEFSGEPEPLWLRVGYYRKKDEDILRWGSQTTITEPLSAWRRLLAHAAEEEPWLLELLRGALGDINRGDSTTT
jgi:hypothetical protein